MGEKVPRVDEPVTYDMETDTYRASFKRGGTAPSTTVVHVLATACGKSPTELPPLNESIDPEVLDRLINPLNPEQRHTDRSVSFSHHGYEVTVESYGLVTVNPRSPRG